MGLILYIGNEGINMITAIICNVNSKWYISSNSKCDI